MKKRLFPVLFLCLILLLSACKDSEETAPIVDTAEISVTTQETKRPTESTEATEPTTTVPEETEPTTTLPVETVPPTTAPAETVPPTTAPAETEPPTTAPAETEPPTTAPAETVPPTTAPAETEPPTTAPAETEPPTTAPAETVPPTTAPAETEPPTTAPAETVPPTTAPAETEPPTTAPAETVPPTTAPAETVPPTTAPAETEPAVEVTKVTMSFVGDCTLGTNQKHTYPNSFHAYYDKNGPDYFLSGVREIFQSDDITVVNLEGSLTNSTDIQQKQWNHKGPPEYVKILSGSSVEVATMGNNHRVDYGQSGFEETKKTLDAAGISYCYDRDFLVYQVKGIKIGFVSVNEVYEGTGVMTYLKEGYKYLRKRGCAAVVACVHWGGDKTTVLESNQLNMGCELIDMGYDLVIGNHPHILQAMRLYKGKFICYSLGNFCYGGNKNPADKDSGIFQQTFHFENGVLTPEIDARFIPCYLSSSQSRNTYQPTLVGGSEFQRIINKMNAYSSTFGLKLDENGRPILP